MKLSHIEHIGIAVKSLDEAIPFWEKQLGMKCYSIEEVKEQKVRTAFFKIGQSKIELLESTEPDGPIGKFIEKKDAIVREADLARPRIGAATEETGIADGVVRSTKGTGGDKG